MLSTAGAKKPLLRPQNEGADKKTARPAAARGGQREKNAFAFGRGRAAARGAQPRESSRVRRSAASAVVSSPPKAVRRKYPCPFLPNPQPGVPTTFASSNR